MHLTWTAYPIIKRALFEPISSSSKALLSLAKKALQLSGYAAPAPRQATQMFLIGAKAWQSHLILLSGDEHLEGFIEGDYCLNAL